MRCEVREAMFEWGGRYDGRYKALGGRYDGEYEVFGGRHDGDMSIGVKRKARRMGSEEEGTIAI